MNVSVTSNQRSITVKIDKTLDKAENKLKTKLVDIAIQLGSRTPVDTGALAESWSAVPTGQRTGGRSVSSRGRPRKQSPGPFRSMAIQNMVADIRGLQLMEEKGVSFVNRAPHARYVGLLDRVINPVRGRYK